MSSCNIRLLTLVKLCLVGTCCVAVVAASTSEKKCRTYAKTKVLYRVLRTTASPPAECCKKGLIAKNTTAKRTLEEHVVLGNKDPNETQYISISTELSVLEKYLNKKPRPKVARITPADIKKAECTVYDTNDAAVMEEHLKDEKGQKLARDSCEVILECKKRLGCEHVDDVKKEIKESGETAN